MGRTAPVMNPACSEHSNRIAARTLQCRGDYRAAAASTVILARALLADLANSAVRPGVYDPEELLGFDPLAPALREQGITAVDQPVTASAAGPTPTPAGAGP